MKYMNRLIAISLTILISGCTANRNMLKEGPNMYGAGYMEEEVVDGVFKIYVKHNPSMFAGQQDVNEDWHKRAKRLCGEHGYRELKSYGSGRRDSFTSYVPLGSAIIPITSSTGTYGKQGYAVCSYVNKEDDDILDEIWDSLSSAK